MDLFLSCMKISIDWNSMSIYCTKKENNYVHIFSNLFKIADYRKHIKVFQVLEYPLTRTKCN